MNRELTSMIVDSHVHVWDLARRPQPWIDPGTMGVIHRSFGLDDLRHALDSAGLPEAVLVQVLNHPDETADFMRLAARTAVVAGVVGWVDLAAGDLDDQIGRLRAGPGATCWSASAIRLRRNRTPRPGRPAPGSCAVSGCWPSTG
jgi:predicted TIM-barrel fold metal-dependent hydrolase